MNRRSFLHRFSTGTAGLVVGSAAFAAATAKARAALPERAGMGPEALAKDETFWREVSTWWAPAPDFINLEYGYYHAAALPTLEVELRKARYINTRNSRYKRTEATEDQEAARVALAAAVGADTEEVAIVRNATEALDALILGIHLSAGDEIVHGDQDYGSMVEAMEQRVARDGVVMKMASIPVHPKNDEEVVAAYAAMMTPRTKVLLVTGLINITGHLLPVRKICDMAHAAGAVVIVDAAHSIGLVDIPIRDWDCDYLGTSLHKWMCSPLGLGMLYAKKGGVDKVWPFFGRTRVAKDNIRKFDQIGTRPESAHVGLLEAIRVHQAIGPANKLARMRYLHGRWVEALKDVPRVVINTPLDPRRYASVGNVGIAGVKGGDLANYWMEKHNIFTAGIGHAKVPGVRVTPGVPTPVEHIDRLVEAMHAALKHFA